MSRILITALALGGLAIPAAAEAQGAFEVRNETRQTLSCGLRRERGSLFDLFLLRPGGAWSQPAANDAARLLQCDVGRIPLRARLRPGIRYVLTEDSASSAIRVVAAAN